MRVRILFAWLSLLLLIGATTAMAESKPPSSRPRPKNAKPIRLSAANSKRSGVRAWLAKDPGNPEAAGLSQEQIGKGTSG